LSLSSLLSPERWSLNFNFLNKSSSQWSYLFIIPSSAVDFMRTGEFFLELAMGIRETNHNDLIAFQLLKSVGWDATFSALQTRT
jgi:hypothetical protein